MTRVWTGVLLCGLASTANAEEQAEVFSGPQAGERLPPLRASLAFGEDAGQVVDFVDLAADRPCLLVIVSGANRPAAALTRSLMNFAEMHSDQLFAGVVYLDSDVSGAGKYLRRAVAWWGVGPPVGVSVDGAEGPGAYGLNRNVNLTILIARHGRVLSNFALIQPSLTDGPRILARVTELIGGRVPGTVELSFLSKPTRKRGDARWRPAPADVALRQLICDALAAEDDEQAEAAATAVEAYVSDNSQRQAELGAAAAGLLKRRGLTEIGDVPIESYLRGWRDVYNAAADDQRRTKQK